MQAGALGTLAPEKKAGATYYPRCFSTPPYSVRIWMGGEGKNRPWRRAGTKALASITLLDPRAAMSKSVARSCISSARQWLPLRAETITPRKRDWDHCVPQVQVLGRSQAAVDTRLSASAAENQQGAANHDLWSLSLALHHRRDQVRRILLLRAWFADAVRMRTFRIQPPLQ